MPVSVLIGRRSLLECFASGDINSGLYLAVVNLCDRLSLGRTRLYFQQRPGGGCSDRVAIWPD